MEKKFPEEWRAREADKLRYKYPKGETEILLVLPHMTIEALWAVFALGGSSSEKCPKNWCWKIGAGVHWRYYLCRGVLH